MRFRAFRCERVKIAWELYIKQISFGRVWTGLDVLDPVGRVWTWLSVIAYFIFVVIYYFMVNKNEGNNGQSSSSVVKKWTMVGSFKVDLGHFVIYMCEVRVHHVQKIFEHCSLMDSKIDHTKY